MPELWFGAFRSHPSGRCTGAALPGQLANLRRGSSLRGGYYARYLRECLLQLPAIDRFLEIGCGNGFFLEHALACGFDEVHGVEPSSDAVDRAPEAVRGRIINDVFRDGLFPTGHFSLVCAFQVFDHLAHPNAVLKACRQILRPGGVVALFINHDIGTWTNRLLGARSPIIDIEHIYLYNQESMTRIFCKNGFEVLRVFPVEDSYPLYYWIRMAPLRRPQEKTDPAAQAVAPGLPDIVVEGGESRHCCQTGL